MENKTETQAAFNAGLSTAKSFEIMGVPAVLVPQGANLQTLEELTTRLRPLRTVVKRNMRTIQQFANYFNRFANDESTVYVDVDAAQFKGVIDHYGVGENTNNQDHSVTYSCPVTDEWSNWKRFDGEWMSQDQLSEFLQDQQLQIVKPAEGAFSTLEKDVVFDKLPDGARMLEIAQTLSITSSSNITSGKNLHNGAMKFEYNEDIEGRAGAKGEFEIPTYFVIGVQLFKEGGHYLILCRFKYRKEGPKLKLRYEMIRPHKTHEHAVRDVIDLITHGRETTNEDGTTTVDSSCKLNTKHIYETI